MSETRDSGVRWLGEIPRDWPVAPAWVLFDERREIAEETDIHLTPSQHYGVLPQSEYQELTGGKVVQKLSDASMKKVLPGDFIVHLRSFQGGIERSSLEGKVSSAYTVLEPTSRIYGAYWKWFLKSSRFIEGLGSSTDQLRDGQTINFSRFSRFQLPIPPLETQRRIADYLDSETAEIDKTVRALDEYEAMVRHRRLALIDNIFKTYKDRIRLKFVVSFLPGYAFRSEEFSDSERGVPLLRGVNIKPGQISLDELAHIEKRNPSFEEYALEAGDVVLGMDRPFISTGTRVATVPEELEGGYLVQRVLKIFGRTPEETRFVFYLLGSKQFKDYLTPDFTGISVPHLSEEQVGNFPIPNVDLARIQLLVALIEEQLENEKRIISLVQALRSLLLKRRQVLINDVVTGKKQV